MKLLYAIPIGTIAMVLVTCGYGMQRNSHISASLDSVQVGWSDSQVVQAVGKPSWIEACGKSFGMPKPNCTEYIYRNSFAPILPEYWSVSFDHGGRVVDTYVYESP
jgi:hypothetical protein